MIFLTSPGGFPVSFLFRVRVGSSSGPFPRARAGPAPYGLTPGGPARARGAREPAEPAGSAGCAGSAGALGSSSSSSSNSSSSSSSRNTTA